MLRRFILRSFPVLIATLAFAQQPSSTSVNARPKVGLALSGGSALGLAHIGVLLWMEQHHVPVDYVAGTSMGGLVGGMYAAGYAPDEIVQFAEHTDWGAAFNPSTPYQYLSFRRKEDQLYTSNDLEFGWKDGLTIPAGLNPGQGVALILSRFAAPYANMKSFDDLPTPFRCVAVNLVNGEKVVFDDGSLQDALRATMSIPGIFTPVRLGNQVLVDGGLLNNVPVGVVKAMGADLVVAVQLETPPPTEQKLDSLIGVIRQSLNVMITDNERRSLADANLVLSPDLKDLDVTDFNRVADFVKRGYEAADRNSATLDKLALPDDEWKAYVAARQAKRRTLSIPNTVVVQGPPHQDNVALAKDLGGFAGKPVNVSKLESALNHITGLGKYATASYQQSPTNAGSDLLVSVQEKKYGPPFVNMGIAIDGSDVNNIRLDFAGRFTFMDVGAHDAELRQDFEVGLVNALATEYYRPIGRSPFFVAPRVFADSQNQDLYSGNSILAQYSFRHAGVGWDFGWESTRNSEFRLGYEYSYEAIVRDAGESVVPNLSGAVSQVRARWAYDGTDGPVIPSRGVRIFSEADWVMHAPGVTKQYPILQTTLQGAKQVSPNYLALYGLAGGTTLSGQGAFPQFAIGGPLQLSALGRYELRGNHYYNGDFLLLRKIGEESFGLFRRTYISGGYEIGDAFNDISAARAFNDGVIGLVGETRIGIVYAGGSVGENGNRKIFFRLGRIF